MSRSYMQSERLALAWSRFLYMYIYTWSLYDPKITSIELPFIYGRILPELLLCLSFLQGTVSFLETFMIFSLLESRLFWIQVGSRKSKRILKIVLNVARV